MAKELITPQFQKDSLAYVVVGADVELIRIAAYGGTLDAVRDADNLVLQETQVHGTLVLVDFFNQTDPLPVFELEGGVVLPALDFLEAISSPAVDFRT